MYRPAPWIVALFVVTAVLPWTAGVAVWVWFGGSMAAVQHAVAPGLVFAAAWNYLVACLIPPLALMLVARTHNGPVTWQRLVDRDRRLFAKTMLATVCAVAFFFFILLWQANQLMIVPMLIASVMVTLVASLAGILVATVTVIASHSLRRHRPTPLSTTSFRRHHHA